MKIGIAFDLKSTPPAGANVPDDADEEYDSPQTIDAIAGVLRGMGHQVVLLGDGREFLEKVLAEKPDFVFNFAEGRGVSRSREARVPAVLEMLDIPFTGSDPFTLAVTLDKDCAKKMVAAAGVAVPAGFALDPAAPIQSISNAHLKFPLVVKPAWEGSSKGIRESCFVRDAAQAAAVVATLRQAHAQTILLEEYIHGEEITVGMLGNEAPIILGMLHPAPKVKGDHFIYSLEHKRDYRRLMTYECPPSLPADTIAAIAEAARTAFRVLGCRDVARVDFRVRDGVPFFLEVNPLPGLHPVDSDLCVIARFVGWSYERLVSTIVHDAMKRCGMNPM